MLHNVTIEPQMEYPSDAFHTFPDHDRVSYLAVNGTVTNLLVFI